MKQQFKSKQTISFSIAQKIAIGGGVSIITIALLFFSLKFINVKDSSASTFCGATISGTQTVSSNTSCSQKTTVDGGILYIEAAVEIDEDFEIKNDGYVVVRNGGSLTITGGHTLTVEGGTFIMNGNVDIDKKLEISSDGDVTLNSGYTLTLEELKIEDSKFDIDGNIVSTKKIEFKKDSDIDFDADATLSTVDMKIEGASFNINKNVSVSEKLEIKKDANVTLESDATLSMEELKVEEADFTQNGTINVSKKFEFKKTGSVNIAGKFNFTGSDESKLKEDMVLNIKDNGTMNLTGSGKFKIEGGSTTLNVNAGGWLLVNYAEFKEGNYTNNGYIEQTSTTNDFTIKEDISGNGIFYTVDKSKLKLQGGAKVHNKNSGGMSDDDFILGSTTIAVKRLPKFKIQEDGLELGDALIVTDTLDLNGRNIDIKSYDMTLPKSFSFNRSGNNSEYIKTSSTGKYNLTILSNNTKHTAPIGRNPYLPVAVNCTDCEGTQFAVAVTENVYANPEQQTGLQSTNGVGETWRVTPNQSFSGTVTFELQWNAGNNGTTNSELSGFNRTICTPGYWMTGTSSSWTSDGVNVNVNASGSDPYYVSIQLTGMSAGVEYFFAVGSGGSALPVEFTSFNAQYANGQVDLVWKTATETNNDYYEVQRSQDGIDWEVVSTLEGAGTTIHSNRYDAVDYAPLQGTSYYRIKQVDYNGEWDVSKTVQVNTSSNGDASLNIASVFPNPFDDQLTIELATAMGGNVSIELYAPNGKLEASKTQEIQTGNNQFTLQNLGNLRSGYYLLKASDGMNQTTRKVIKK